jgi:glycosyltransferase involved in cell wall biosynthesis
LSLLRGRARFDAHPTRAGDPGDGISLLALTPTYLPEHRRGAEVTLHLVLQALHARGYECTVMVEHAKQPEQTIDGIRVVERRTGDAAGLPSRADVVLAQLDARWSGMKLAARHRHPFVYYMHIGATPRSHLSGHPDLTVFSSRFLEQRHPWITPSLVVHPPIRAADYRTEPGTAITLVNLTEEKGAPLFWDLAGRLPARQFLAVRGWGPQLVPSTVPSNVDVIGPLDDMRAAYSRTRVLLAPTVYESFGRVPLEAAISGIPTIAHPADGLREALGEAAVWVDRDDADAWVRAIEALDDDEWYRARAAAALDQFASYDSDAEIDALDRALRALLVRAAR